MKTCLASDPQIPVIRVLAMTQLSLGGVGASRSTNRIGTLARPARSRLDLSVGSHSSGFTPHSSACMSGPSLWSSAQLDCAAPQPFCPEAGVAATAG